ncbi:ATP-binding protein [Bhargavaea beijingensis]|uniref:histidine kinase n=1 Tax=Bhargavaea beijingensis TaxID=426756 RepID=A0A1G7APK4_9BACL|nr:ATP-binding protein [Bhargavaea beijingensis]MCW1928220.1 cell wall metabolism sensor histidine kinase WalK [Bhargavaea beijingensis]SDE16630.1 two-component system, OmpR family, sensor histidine kinase ResE [Bhargavaea beijingensis]
MNRIWNSIVGKLWATILLLVSFVLFIVSVLLLEFLGNFYGNQAENTLRQQAVTISKIVDQHEDPTASIYVIDDLLGEDTSAIIVDVSGKVVDAFHEEKNGSKIREILLNDKELSRVFGEDSPVVKEMNLPSAADADRLEAHSVLAAPLHEGDRLNGAVFVYQNMEAVHENIRQTNYIVLLSAFIAFVLTTFFAFFLSSRITSPLRKLKEAANSLAEGRYDTEVPTPQHDEIGDLAVAFNKMGRQVKHNLEVIGQEKEQLQNILTSMTDAVISFNRDGSILLTNPPADRLLKKWRDARKDKEGDIPDEITGMLNHVVMYSEEVEDELPLDGQYFDITISPLYSGSYIRGAVAVFRDMTEQHRLDKVRTDFLANVSHELRTPISMLIGYSEALSDGIVETEEDREEMMKIIRDEAMRMGRLVNDTLDLTRLESGYMRLYKEPTAVRPMVERIASKFIQKARDADITLKVDAAGAGEAIVDLDEDRIEQVMTNLIDNAIRHTPSGGTVEVKSSADDGLLEVAVADTGSGIAEEDLTYVFERFYKADKARTRGKGGTGLGLAIAKNIVESHGGWIRADSRLGKGTTMTFSIPFEER